MTTLYPVGIRVYKEIDGYLISWLGCYSSMCKIYIISEATLNLSKQEWYGMRLHRSSHTFTKILFHSLHVYKHGRHNLLETSSHHPRTKSCQNIHLGDWAIHWSFCSHDGQNQTIIGRNSFGLVEWCWKTVLKIIAICNVDAILTSLIVSIRKSYDWNLLFRFVLTTSGAIISHIANNWLKITLFTNSGKDLNSYNQYVM